MEVTVNRIRKRGLSLLEIVFGAMIIGLSALPILELLRSSTVSLQVTETEAAARALAADVLERFASPVHGAGREVGRGTQRMLGVPVAWKDLIKEDPFLSHGFPKALEPLLEQSDLRVTLNVQTVSHAALAPSTGVEWYTVTASFRDRNDNRTEVALGRFVDRW